MEQEKQNVFKFERIPNFRDLGGFRGRGGRVIAPGRLYRSGQLLDMTDADKAILKDQIRLKTVLDLTSPDDVKKRREIRLLEETGIKYFNIPFRPPVVNYFTKEMELYARTTDMGEVYLYRLRHKGFAKQLFTILEIMAEPQHYPILFHCGAGKDRTGVLAAFTLKLLGVSDADVIEEYALTDAAMEEVKQRVCADPATSGEVKNLPDFTWRAPPQFMKTFLDGLKEEYGSAAGYLKKHGAEKTLVKRLEKALLEDKG